VNPLTSTSGGIITILDVTRDAGSTTAAASVTLSQIPLSTTRSVPQLLSGAADSGSINAIIPLTTTPGDYYVIGCADGLSVITESDESDNCSASGMAVRITSVIVIHPTAGTQFALTELLNTTTTPISFEAGPMTTSTIVSWNVRRQY